MFLYLASRNIVTRLETFLITVSFISPWKFNFFAINATNVDLVTNTISNIDENFRPKINFDFDDVCYFALEI